MSANTHAGLLTKGIKFYLDDAEVPNLQEIPDLGGSADQVDVTTLADGAYMYINGIKSYGTLDFTFLYDNSSAESNYRVIRAAEEDESAHEVKVEFPDGTTFEMTGMISATITGAGVNAALQFTATVNLQSDITVTNPSGSTEEPANPGQL